ncbi:hypothetical protein ACPB8Q_02405 [Methanocaldococcus indicus]|uniref:hypothetical protein n=1 Tax=Methanocaldococcus indicus TaxID=213231 RepID=UPI003C6D4C27
MCAPVSATIAVSSSTLLTAFTLAQVLGIAAIIGAVGFIFKDVLNSKVANRS